MDNKFNVYDKVWVMYNNKPEKKIVYSVTFEMNLMKNGIDIFYNLADGRLSATESKSMRVSEEMIFDSKEDLLNSL